jgi:pimeloyl-ACP methyl ester carboxylesterase
MNIARAARRRKLRLIIPGMAVAIVGLLVSFSPIASAHATTRTAPAGGLPAAEARVLAATQRPLATIALTQPTGVPAWETIPSWAVVGTADHAIPLALQLAMAENAHAHITEINAPHLSMISDPDAVFSVILQAIRATT